MDKSWGKQILFSLAFPNLHIFADIRVLWYEQNSKLCTLPKSLHFQIWINCAFTSYINKHSKKQKCEFSLKVNSSKNKWIQKYVKEENKKKWLLKEKFSIAYLQEIVLFFCMLSTVLLTIFVCLLRKHISISEFPRGRDKRPTVC